VALQTVADSLQTKARAGTTRLIQVRRNLEKTESRRLEFLDTVLVDVKVDADDGTRGTAGQLSSTLNP
jgi:hypothetical protein